MANSTAEQTDTAAEPPVTIVYLGNRKAISVQGDERVPYPGKRCTTVRIPAGTSLMDAAKDIAGPQGLWVAHSDAQAPAWVAAEGPMANAITVLLADHFKCEIRDPDPEG